MMSKQFADLRIKLGAKRSNANSNTKGSLAGDAADYLPADIDPDQWAEIHKYNY